MSLNLISNAYADGGAAAPAQDGGSMIMLTLFLVIAFVFMMWQQQKRFKQQKSMVDSLQKGDELVTIGGTLGRVEKVGDNYLSIEVASGAIPNPAAITAT